MAQAILTFCIREYVYETLLSAVSKLKLDSLMDVGTESYIWAHQIIYLWQQRESITPGKKSSMDTSIQKFILKNYTIFTELYLQMYMNLFSLKTF